MKVFDPNTPPTIITSSVPSIRTESYNSVIFEVEGAIPMTWRIVSGDLPTGMTLDSDGKFSGTLEKAGTFIFTVEAENDKGSDTRIFAFIVQEESIPDTAPSITTDSKLIDGITGTEYSVILSATGITPITWSRTNAPLLNGLTLSESGVISGIPTEAGEFSFTAEAKNDISSDSRTFNIKISSSAIKSKFITKTLPSAPLNKTYSAAIGFEGSTLTGISCPDLPEGLAIDSQGRITALR